MRSLAWIVRETFRRDALLASVAALNLALALVLVPLAFVDPMQLLGISRWLKPMKFAISIGLFTGTMAWILSWVRAGSPRLTTAMSLTIAISMLGEIILIAGQSIRGAQSHFNNATPFDATVFSLMGGFIVLNTLAVAVVLYLVWFRPIAATGAHRLGVRLGVLLFLLASAEGGLMLLEGSHSVGIADGGPGLPFVNWSTTGGDLRVAHFLGMHALQALPLLGWLLDKRGAERGRMVVGGVAIAWAIGTAWLVAQALRGVPLVA